MNKNFCFCTLALGKRYRDLAKALANDISGYSLGTKFVVLTDKPEEFKDCSNVLAFKHRQRGIFTCFNDKRFVIEKALSLFNTAIIVDSDTRITGPLPKEIVFAPGISGCFEDLIKHTQKNRPERLERIKNIARKLNIPIEGANWIGESLCIITKDGGREREFIRYWGVITSYLELHGIHDGEGAVMGLAARKVGWSVNDSAWSVLHGHTKHLDASDRRSKVPFWQKLQKRIVYHWRLNKARIAALRDFDFFYR